MPGPLQLKIPKPCHENWEAMTPNEQGRFCMSCQKTVIDFRVLSDKEILDYITNASSNTCGRFNEDQLNRKITVRKERGIGSWKYLWNMLVSTFLLAGEVSAQSKPMILGEFVLLKKNPPPPAKTKIVLGRMTPIKPDDKATISGMVIDMDQQPVGFASIEVKGVSGGIAADAEGKFLLKNISFVDSVVLAVSAVGYAATEYKVTSLREAQNLVIVLQHDVVPLAEVSVVAYPAITCTGIAGGITMVTECTTYEKVKREVIAWIPDNKWIAKKNIKVYPNPITPGHSLNLQVSMKESGSYKMELMTTDGRIVHVQPLLMQEKVQTVVIPTDAAWSKGVYWLRITGRNTKKDYQAKVVLQ